MISEIAYKETEIGKIPEEWEVVELSEIADIIMGQSPPSSSYNEDGEGLPFFQGRTEFGEIFPTPRKWCSLPSKIAEENDVLISVRAPVGDINMCTAKSCIGRGLGAVRAKEKEADSWFLYYLLQSLKSRFNLLGQGSTFTAINGGELRKLLVIKPSYREQQKISEILSAADEQIEKTKQLIEKNKELKKVLMQQLFTTGIGHSEFKDTIMGKIPKYWKLASLEDISKFITKGSTPTTYGFNWQDQGVFFFKSDVVKNGKFVYGDFKYIDENAHQHMLRSQIQAGDILITITGNIGRVALVPEEIKRANINQHIARISVENPEFNPIFVFYWLSQSKFIEYYNSIKTGLAYPQISLKQVRETIVPIPSIEEQKKIAEILTSVDEQIDIYEKEKEKQIKLKKALMQQLLTGKIRVTV